MLPDLVQRAAFPLKSKKRDEIAYPTSKVDLEKELRKQDLTINQSKTLHQGLFSASSQSATRKTMSAKNAARLFDKKTITQRIEQRKPTSSGSAVSPPTAEANNFGRQNPNIVSAAGSMNMKIVTDNISRNVLVYTPKTDGREKFQSASLYPDSLRQIDKKIQKYKQALASAIHAQQNAVESNAHFFQLDDQLDDGDGDYPAAVDPPRNQEENFDFLTGIGISKQQTTKQEEETVTKQDYNQEATIAVKDQTEETNQQLQQQGNTITASPPQQFEEVRKAFSEIYQQYQNQISKAFIKKEQPKARVRRKNPKINITSKNNAVKKTGVPFDQVEHLMRVYNREHVPCHPEILVPSFQQRKDNIANTVLAYLKDYRPLLSGDKANIPKSIQGLLEIEMEMIKAEGIKPHNYHLAYHLPEEGSVQLSQQQNQHQHNHQQQQQTPKEKEENVLDKVSEREVVYQMVQGSQSNAAIRIAGLKRLSQVSKDSSMISISEGKHVEFSVKSLPRRYPQNDIHKQQQQQQQAALLQQQYMFPLQKSL